MIIPAEYNMIPELKKLWKEGFKAEDRYIDFFFSKRFKPENTFVYVEKGSPISIASVLNAKLYYNGAFLPVGYIYGVTTSAMHRRKGFSAAILEHINKIYPATFLVPATAELFNFYEKQGFLPAFKLNEFNLYACDLKTPNKILKGKAVCPEEYNDIRNSYFLNDGYICWDTEAITYALAENELLGGSALKFPIDEKKGENGILLYRKEYNNLLIMETTLPASMLQDAAHYLMKQENVSVCSVRTAPGESSVARIFGLLNTGISIKNGYCNLVLD